MVGYRSPITTLESWHFGKLEISNFLNFEFFIFGILAFWKVGILEFLNV